MTCARWVGWPVCRAGQHVGTATVALSARLALPALGGGEGGSTVEVTVALLAPPTGVRVVVKAGQCRGGYCPTVPTSGARVVGGEHPLALALLGGLRHLLGVHETEAAVLLCGCG